jgi:hypothetical protein
MPQGRVRMTALAAGIKPCPAYLSDDDLDSAGLVAVETGAGVLALSVLSLGAASFLPLLVASAGADLRA